MKAANFMTSSLLSGHNGSLAGFCTHRITAVVSDLKAAWSPEQAENWEAHIRDIVGHHPLGRAALGLSRG